jgi:hypothetical protein
MIWLCCIGNTKTPNSAKHKNTHKGTVFHVFIMHCIHCRYMYQSMSLALQLTYTVHVNTCTSILQYTHACCFAVAEMKYKVLCMQYCHAAHTAVALSKPLNASSALAHCEHEQQMYDCQPLICLLFPASHVCCIEQLQTSAWQLLLLLLPSSTLYFMKFVSHQNLLLALLP